MRVDIIIAGVQKCGTTALHSFLNKHPKVIGSDPKELDFFNYQGNYLKGTALYHSFFSPQPPLARLRGYKFMEASPSYMIDGDVRETARRIKAYNPDIRVVSLVRNPVSRAFSAWHMYRKRFEDGQRDWWSQWVHARTGQVPSDVVQRTADEYRDFKLFVATEIDCRRRGQAIECPVLACGLYHTGIEAFQQAFGDHFRVLAHEQLNRHTASTLDEVAGFLRLPAYDWKMFEGQKVNHGGYDDEAPEDSRGMLLDFYQDSIGRLRELTGISYSNHGSCSTEH